MTTEKVDVSEFMLDVDTRTRNEQRAAARKPHADVCLRCGKGVREGTPMVRMHVDGYLVPADAVLDEADDQGWFPVGPDCARRLPKGYIG